MIKGKEFHSIISRIFNGDVKGYNESQQLQVNCPRCQQREGLSTPDGKYNLEINTAKRVFRCWKCDEPKFSGSLGKLIRIFGTYSDQELYKSYGGSYIDIFNEEDEEEFIPEIKLPDEFISFSDLDISDQEHLAAYSYMVVERKINRETLLKYRLGFCTTGKYAGRIIIPSYDATGEINYFVSRTYRRGVKPTYLNPKIDKDRIIFNEGMINWDSTIYIVEGAFEMFSLVNGAPQLGKTISKALFFKLKEKRPPIVIVLDPDAYKNAIEMVTLLKTIYVGEENKVKIVKLKGEEDLDEIRRNSGKKIMLSYLYNAEELSTDDYMNMRLFNNKYVWKSKTNYRTYK